MNIHLHFSVLELRTIEGTFTPLVKTGSKKGVHLAFTAH